MSNIGVSICGGGALEKLNASLVVKSDGVKEFHLKWGGGSTQLQLINGTLKEAA